MKVFCNTPISLSITTGSRLMWDGKSEGRVRGSTLSDNTDPLAVAGHDEGLFGETESFNNNPDSFLTVMEWRERAVAASSGVGVGMLGGVKLGDDIVGLGLVEAVGAIGL
jgi:hypothetical protein